MVKAAKDCGIYNTIIPEELGPKERKIGNMALTRTLLKGLGLTEEQVGTIIEAHSETVNGLKEELGTYKAAAEKLPGVQKELDDLKAKRHLQSSRNMV